MPALLAAALLALSACGTSAPAGGTSPAPASRPPNGGEVRLVVSRDFGATIITDLLAEAGDGLTVMRLLAEHCEVDTQYGGGFVSGIDGLASGADSDGGEGDWFFWVDGVMGQVGAGDHSVGGGQTVWWDFHSWEGAMFIPGALHAFPAPFARQAMILDALTPAFRAPALEWATDRGISVSTASPAAGAAPAGFVVGTPSQLAKHRLAGAALASGADAGVFLTVEDNRLIALRRGGGRARELRAAAFATPDAAHPDRLALVIAARTTTDLRELLRHLSPDETSARVAVGLTDDGRVVALPFAEADP